MRVIIRDGDEITVADTNSIDDPRYIVIGETGGSGKAHTFNVPAVTGSYTYNGAVQTPALSEFYSDFMTLSGEVSETNAGTYTITVALKDIANCQWSDHSVGNKTLTWSISKAALPKPSISPSSITLSEISPTATFAVSRAGDGEIIVTSSNPEAVSATVSGNTVTVTALHPETESTATLTVTIAEGTNFFAYSSDDVICSARVILPSVDGTIRIRGAGLTFKTAAKRWDGTLEYSLDTIDWYEYTGGTEITTNGEIYLRGISNTKVSGHYTNTSVPVFILSGNNISVDGVLENILDYATVIAGGHPTAATTYAFSHLFANTPVVSAKDLILPETLNNSMLVSMFDGCTSLINAPALPATTLAQYCYSAMFRSCTSLIDAPALPATTLAQYCYSSMFNGCTSLINAPALPATTLAQHSYLEMFRNCTSLINAPALPATTLAQYCYQRMFIGCRSLVDAPALPAMSLAIYCYSEMFTNCTSLVNAPVLPALTTVQHCYHQMFAGCTSLVNAPEIKATYMSGISCCDNMFADCTSLETLPIIKATYFNSKALYYMFNRCSKVKISTAEADEYINTYRVPYSGTGIIYNTSSLEGMFYGTGGTFTGTPTVNTTYYTSNAVIS